jgi:hypothetical protein
MSCEEAAIDQSLQDQAEAFWHRLAPDIPQNLLTRIAFNFGPHRQITASQTNLELAETINRACHWDGKTRGFVKTPFGRIVFAEPE